MISIYRILKDASKFSIPTLVSAIASLAVIPVISHMYPAEEYGVINLFYSLGNCLMTLALLGLDNSLIRFFHEEIEGIDNCQIFSFSLLSSGVVIGVLTFGEFVFFPEQASSFVFGETNCVGLALLSIYTLSLIIFRLLSIVTRQECNARKYNTQQIGLMASNKVLFALALIVSSKYMPSIILLTFWTFVLAVYYLMTTGRKYLTTRINCIPRNAMLKIFGFALPTMPAAMLMWVNNSIAKFALAMNGNFDGVGVFALAFTIANAFQVVPSAFSVYWSPFVYSHYQKEQNTIKKMQTIITGLTLLIVIAILALQDFLYSLVGPEYAVSKKYFMIMMLFPIQTLLVETVGYGIYLSNKTHLRLAITGLSALINVGLCAILIPAYGDFGAAVALGVSAIVVLIGSYYFGQKYYKSLESHFTTIAAYTVIIVLCIVNYWASYSTIFKVIATLIGLAIWLILYGKNLKLAFYKIRRKHEI